MMEVEKPWEFREEVDIMEDQEEEDAGALRTRQRKNNKAAADPNGDGEPNSFNEEEDNKEDEAEPEEKKQSVFFDSTNVSDNATESSTGQEVTKMEQFSSEKENGNESAEGIELDKHENFYAQENNKSEGNDKLENGFHSNGVQEAYISSETTADREAALKLIETVVESANNLENKSGALDISNRIMTRTQITEIEVDKDENDTKSNVNIEEYDLEKILDEQETHDLYCPNCKSCITRRVILRKRKRTVRQALRDEPPKKTQIAEPSAHVSNQMAAETHDQDAPEVFRCLSCFTFFIPAGCGFNIFRIFGRRDMNQQIQDQHPSASHESENCGSWLLSCFQTVDSPKTPADAGPAKDPLLSDAQITGDKNSSAEDNTSSVHTDSTTTASVVSSSMSQQFHGTTSSTVTFDTSSSTTSTTSVISSSQSTTRFVKTEKWMATGQQHAGCQEQIHLSEPANDALTDSIHLNRKEDVPRNTKPVTSDKNSFFNQDFFKSGLKFPDAIPPKVLPGVNNLSSQKPSPVIPAPVPSKSPDHLTIPIIPTDVPPAPVPASAQGDEWDILKAIVYGGLVESITSLSVVSAAAASSAKTLDIFVLGVANLIGGLPIIFHNIADLRNLGDANENDEQVGHYWLQLGRRSKYRLHMVMALMSYILFGLLPPVVYGLLFRKSDNRENKMMVVAAASLACIGLLAIGKAHVKRPRTYFTNLLYYLSIGFSASGLSYVAGVLITRLLAHFGLIDQGGSAPSAALGLPGLLLPDANGSDATAWASY